MDIVFENDEFVVIDNFLEPQDLSLVWHYMQDENYTFVSHQQWIKAFRLSDGQPLHGPVYISHPYEDDTTSAVYPSSRGIDLLMDKVSALQTYLARWIGKQGIDWSYFFARSYLYPSHTGLSWHRDNNLTVTGAYAFYCHPTWNVQWGGELLIANSSTKEFQYERKRLLDGRLKFLGSHLDNSQENEQLLAQGIGHYILPKPNRFIALTAGVLHTIKKVDAAVGHHVRASIQGFFLYPEKFAQLSMS